MRNLFVSDFTLRKIVQDGTGELLFREKTAIAACADSIGVDQIELPPVLKEKEDRIIYKTIASAVRAQVAVPAGYDEKSVCLAWECIRSAQAPCLQIMLPVSTAQMEYSFRAKEAAMLEKIRKLVLLAREQCESVEFSALDATRADPEFVLNACLAAQQSGASRLVLCDDSGVSLPDEIAALVKKVKQVCTAPVLVSLRNPIGMAPACAYAAAAAGADGVKTAMTGKDVLLTEQLSGLIAARGEECGVGVRLNDTELHRDIMQTLRQMQHKQQKAELSENSASADVFLDAESSLTDVCEAVSALGYTLSDEDSGKVYKALQQVCQKKDSLSSRELEALIASNAMQAPSTYHLASFSANCTNIGAAMAQVTLRRQGETLLGVATGDGPIDAAFRAIEQCVGYHYELDEFQIQAVTEGKEALGSALVRLRSNGRLYAGNGLSTDIVGASIRAYINALNKIVFEEQ